MRRYVVLAIVSLALVAGAAPASAEVDVSRSFKSVVVTKSSGYFASIYQPDREVDLDLNEASKPPARGCPITTSNVLSGCIRGGS